MAVAWFVCGQWLGQSHETSRLDTSRSLGLDLGVRMSLAIDNACVYCQGTKTMTPCLIALFRTKQAILMLDAHVHTRNPAGSPILGKPVGSRVACASYFLR